MCYIDIELLFPTIETLSSFYSPLARIANVTYETISAPFEIFDILFNVPYTEYNDK